MRLAFVGDLYFGGKVAQSCKQFGASYPLGNVTSILSAFDVKVGNLECCIVDHTCTHSVHGSPFAVPSSAIGSLSQGRFDVFSLANNHIMDCGIEGLRATMKNIESIGAVHVGAGLNITEAGATKWLNRSGKRLAFIAACDCSGYRATDTAAGVFPMSRRGLVARVRDAASCADLVIVSLHGDVEFVRYPAPWRVKLSRRLVDEGAHIVVSHHPHVSQGIEQYKNGLIAYSLGNFVYRINGNRYQQGRNGTADSFIWSVYAHFDGNPSPRLSFECIPIAICNDHRPVPVEGSGAAAQVEVLKQLSAALSNGTLLRKSWHATCSQKVRSRLWDAYYAARRGEIRRATRNVWNMVGKSESRAWLVGYFSRGLI